MNQLALIIRKMSWKRDERAADACLNEFWKNCCLFFYLQKRFYSRMRAGKLGMSSDMVLLFLSHEGLFLSRSRIDILKLLRWEIILTEILYLGFFWPAFDIFGNEKINVQLLIEWDIGLKVTSYKNLRGTKRQLNFMSLFASCGGQNCVNLTNSISDG